MQSRRRFSRLMRDAIASGKTVTDAISEASVPPLPKAKDFKDRVRMSLNRGMSADKALADALGK